MRGLILISTGNRDHVAYVLRSGSARFVITGGVHPASALPPIVRAVHQAGYPVVWACDPMHGNTFVHESGFKTRHFDDVMAELDV